MIDASAVARVTGIEAKFEDMRAGSVLFLPQRIAVFAQGATGAVFSTDKWPASSAGAGGSRYGFGSPIHLILRELLPANGDGVGTIPVTVYPLAEPVGAVAASGDIAASGSASRASAFRLRIGGVLSEAFVVAAGTVDAAAVAAAIGRAVRAVLEMPVDVGFTYGAPTSTPGTNVGNGTLSALSVSGAPTPGQWTLRVNTAVPNGGVFTLQDPSGTVVADDIAMTAGVGTATPLTNSGLSFTLTDGTTNFAVGDRFTINVPATEVLFTAKWKGASGNAITIEVIGDESVGVVWAVTQMSGGLLNPDVTAALSKVGNVWESLAINGAPIEDTDVLDAFQAFGVGRWDDLVRKPLVVFTGVTHAAVEDATAVTSARRTDNVNAALTLPGSPSLPFVVAARMLARIARMANNNPASDYGGLRATGLVPGKDEAQWDARTRDRAVKLGCSTSEVRDGVPSVSDVVTFYRPTGEEPPAYRFAKDIVKLQNIIFNIDLNFASEDWDGAPLIPDDQATVNPRARKAKIAVGEARAIIDSLALHALLSDPATAKKKVTAAISSSNPNRLDLKIPVQVSGNSNIRAVELRWGFFFGTPVAS